MSFFLKFECISAFINDRWFFPGHLLIRSSLCLSKIKMLSFGFTHILNCYFFQNVYSINVSNTSQRTRISIVPAFANQHHIYISSYRLISERVYIMVYTDNCSMCISNKINNGHAAQVFQKRLTITSYLVIFS